MNSQFQQLYNLLFSHLITPYNLVDNARLPNYDYVTFSKGPKGLLVSMRCSIEPTSNNAVFLYFFDNEDRLEKVTMKTPEETQTIFDRQNEVELARKKWLMNREESLSTVAL